MFGDRVWGQGDSKGGPWDTPQFPFCVQLEKKNQILESVFRRDKEILKTWCNLLIDTNYIYIIIFIIIYLIL